MGSAAFNMVTMWFINQYLTGYVVGKLPFKPISMFASMTHRGLSGDDEYEFSLFFVAILCNMALRGVIPKAFGFETPRMPME